MQRSIRQFARAAALVGAMLALAVARAETCSLELKRLDAKGSPTDYIYRNTNPQYFSLQWVAEGSKTGVMPGNNPAELAAFRKIVTKEPKYESDRPFRGVVKLGSHEYAFALDAVPPKPEAKDKKTKKKQKVKKVQWQIAQATQHRGLSGSRAVPY